MYKASWTIHEPLRIQNTLDAETYRIDIASPKGAMYGILHRKGGDINDKYLVLLIYGISQGQLSL